VYALRPVARDYAAVDVTKRAVLDSPLLQLDNALCTPHLASLEKESYEGYFATAFEQVLAFANGQPMEIINPQALAHR